MPCPRSLFDQRIARCRGEILRGSGVWPSWGCAPALEPPFEPFKWKNITRWDLSVHGFTAPYQGQFIDRLKRLFFPAPAPPDELYGDFQVRKGILHITSIAHYAEDEVTYQKAEQLILALGTTQDPIAFELFGSGGIGGNSTEGSIEVRFAAGDLDLPLLEAQLHAHYPRSAVVSRQYCETAEELAWNDRVRGQKQESLFVAPLYLVQPYCFPIRTYGSFSVDPLGTAVAVMDELRPDEWALVQVLFCRARHAWAENLRLACQDPYREGELMPPNLDRRTLAEKIQHPLYAVAITLASNRASIFDRMAALAHQYESPSNRLAVRDEAAWARQWGNDPFPELRYWRLAIGDREAVAPGMLLNAAELASIVHLPNPDLPAERLLRVKTQTRQPPKPALKATSIVIGHNTHRGKRCQVAIPPDLRSRHCYIAGASGTGKSTLLLQMIVQDMLAGHGVGLLDPHGDLVNAVLRHVPENRINDVVLFDAADTEYPFALNILEARDESERERIVAETIMSLERYFPASWGPRLERILQYTLRTVLHAIPGATLADVEQMLTDAEYRESVLAKTSDQRLLQFWKTQFPFFPKNSMDPVLNKLSVFLMDRHVRNITCQRHASINFDSLLNEGKILLANLSTGLLTEKVAGTFGSFLVTKIVNAAFRRAAMPESQRRPWYLYVDEFQNFMNVSVGFEHILAESRKYKLSLAGLANQFIGQLSPTVRQAIFGNIGTLIIFRLGIDDANTVAKELGVFTAQDVLNLELGQAIVRAGGSSSAFNLQTLPESMAPGTDPTGRIVAQTRKLYARLRADVERELSGVAVSSRTEKAAIGMQERAEEPSDPWEDDLVR